MFEVAREEPLQGFLYRLWRIDPASFDIESAVLESPAGDGTTSVQTKFNVRAVLAGTAEDTLVVRPGDFVVIPPAPRNVFVTGEVMLPGPVPFQPGLKAEHYVTLAGGPNASGSYGKLKLISLDGETRDGNRNSEVYRGDTVVVGVKTSKIWGSIWVGIVSVTGLAVALVALSNSVKD